MALPLYGPPSVGCISLFPKTEAESQDRDIERSKGDTEQKGRGRRRSQRSQRLPLSRGAARPHDVLGKEGQQRPQPTSSSSEAPHGSHAACWARPPASPPGPQAQARAPTAPFQGPGSAPCRPRSSTHTLRAGSSSPPLSGPCVDPGSPLPHPGRRQQTREGPRRTGSRSSCLNGHGRDTSTRGQSAQTCFRVQGGREEKSPTADRPFQLFSATAAGGRATR